MGLGVFVASASSSSPVPPPVDPGGWSPSPETNNTGAPIPAFRVCYMSADDEITMAQADGTFAEAKGVCMTLEAIADGAEGDTVFGGRVNGVGVGHAFGELGYLSNTPGEITNIPNETPGEYLVQLGFWLNATDFQFSPQVPILN